MVKRIIAIVLVIILCAALFSGCGKNTSTDTSKSNQSTSTETPKLCGETQTDKLIIWSGSGDGSPASKVYNEVMAQYKAKYPNVDVQINYMGADGTTALQTMFKNPSDPNFPDVIEASDTNLNTYAKDNLLYCFDDALQTASYEKADVKWIDTYIPSLVESQKLNGKSYMVPNSYYSNGFFYDKNLFKKHNLSIPKTWDEFIKLGEDLNRLGIAPIACDGTLDMYNLWFFVVFAERYVDGNKMLETAKGNGSFKDDAGYLKAAQLTAELKAKNMFQKGFEGSAYPACQAVFAQGKAGMHFCGGWLPSEMSQIKPATMEFGVFPIPALPGEVFPHAAEIWGNGNSILAEARNKYNAINWLKMLSSATNADKSIAMDVPSPIKGTPTVKALEGYNDFVANAEQVYPSFDALTFLGDYTTKIFGPICSKLVTGKLTAEKFIDQLDTQTKAFYKK